MVCSIISESLDMKKTKLGPFATLKNKNTVTAVPITLAAAVPQGYVDDARFPGLLSRAAVDVDLKLDMPTWFPPSSTANPSTRDDHIDDVGDFQTGFIGSTVLTAPGPYVATIPLIWLTQGTHTYSYKVTRTVGGINVSGSAAVTFIVDRWAPYQTAGISPRALLMPVGHSGPLTAAYFAANGNVAKFPIPNYDAYDAQLGDTWEQLNGPNGAVVASGEVFPDMEVTLTLAQAMLWEGATTLYYRLRDAAGNVSTTSLGLAVSISIRPAPVLQSPGVKYALTLAGSGDRLIDLADAAAALGMFVIIPDYDEDRAQDNLYVRLTTLHGTQQVGPLPLGAGALPLDFFVGYPVLKLLYGTSFAPIAMTVTYGVERGGVFHWLPTASEVIIELDLSKAGPVNPDEPDLENPNLLLPVLTGPGSGLTNQLDPRDAPMDAPVAITLWTVAPLPSARAFTINLFYAGELVDSVPVDHLNLPPSGVVDMEVSWPFIQKHGNSTSSPIPLHYEIVTAGTSNRNVSPAQGIDVSANVISFNQPTIVGAVVSGSNVIMACSAVQNASVNGGYVVVNVPPHSLFTQGMVITVVWEAFSDDAGTVPIAGASGSFPHTPLNPSEVVTGFNLRIQPGTTYIKPIYDFTMDVGSVRVKYSVPILGPSPVDSAETHALVRTYLSGSTPTYCDGTFWP